MIVLRPETQKRYGWFRLHNDFCGHRKWRLAKIGVGPIGTAPLNSSWIWRTHEISRQLDLALFYDRELNLKTPPR
jgi:hypothetical protein